ncbi:unnamed protein product [Cylicocyclus nassatus]|uniref:Uncharacterized protein n=1 Tax=Cylicocyclus nassatus TaxID=53992 RepID=A0AA36GXZ0_CYLNA|nr:unnamed protein product [Cylicocyclus nassatus]
MSSCRPLLVPPRPLATSAIYGSSTLLVVLAELLSFVCAVGAYDDYGGGHRSHAVAGVRHEPERQMVCNNGTDYQCICRTGVPPASDVIAGPPIIECDQFIQSLELPVVDMRLRHVNLEAHLHTNEKYETYFKRRIANIVSSYCEHQANECPGATLRLAQTVSDASRSDDDDDKSVLYAADDESEPLLTQNNVVLLRVEREPVNVTRILFAITKSENVGSLNEQMIIDPVKVKYILGSQAGPLARILGGIKLDSVRVSRIRRHLSPADTDNTKLIYILSVVGAFFAICYIIGAIRLCRDARKRKRERKAAEDAANGLATVNAIPNYGACQRKPSKNGAVKQKTEQNVPTTYGEINEPVENYDSNEPHVLTERQARFMFMCDPSQLPREPTFDSETALESEPHPRSSAPREERIVEERYKHTENPVKPVKEEPPEEKPKQTPAANEQEVPVPALVLVPSFSLDSPMTSEESPVAAEPTTAFLDEPDSPDDRPKSRRGSRVGDEVLDLREVGASPVNENNGFGHPHEVIVVDVAKERRNPELNRWSSSEGEVDVYYKLSDDEDTIRGDDWSRIKPPPLQENNLRSEESESDVDDEEDERLTKQDSEVDGYVYERLREELTPVPPDS